MSAIAARGEPCHVSPEYGVARDVQQEPMAKYTSWHAGGRGGSLVLRAAGHLSDLGGVPAPSCPWTSAAALWLGLGSNLLGTRRRRCVAS